MASDQDAEQIGLQADARARRMRLGAYLLTALAGVYITLGIAPKRYITSRNNAIALSEFSKSIQSSPENDSSLKYRADISDKLYGLRGALKLSEDNPRRLENLAKGVRDPSVPLNEIRYGLERASCGEVSGINTAVNDGCIGLLLTIASGLRCRKLIDSEIEE